MLKKQPFSFGDALGHDTYIVIDHLSSLRTLGQQLCVGNSFSTGSSWGVRREWGICILTPLLTQ